MQEPKQITYSSLEEYKDNRQNLLEEISKGYAPFPLHGFNIIDASLSPEELEKNGLDATMLTFVGSEDPFEEPIPYVTVEPIKEENGSIIFNLTPIDLGDDSSIVIIMALNIIYGRKYLASFQAEEAIRTVQQIIKEIKQEESEIPSLVPAAAAAAAVSSELSEKEQKTSRLE